jgi:hypothetical protein
MQEFQGKLEQAQQETKRELLASLNIVSVALENIDYVS